MDFETKAAKININEMQRYIYIYFILLHKSFTQRDIYLLPHPICLLHSAASFLTKIRAHHPKAWNLTCLETQKNILFCLFLHVTAIVLGQSRGDQTQSPLRIFLQHPSALAWTDQTESYWNPYCHAPPLFPQKVDAQYQEGSA